MYYRHQVLSASVLAISFLSSAAVGQNTSALCEVVFNREFSDNIDVDMFGIPDPGQVLFFDCFGGTLDNIFRDLDRANFGFQVDALANRNDRLFQALVNDNAELIFSVTGDRNIYFERENTGRNDVWVEDVAINDVDALEVWGDSNSDWHSFQGDPDGVALFYVGDLGFVNIMQTDILTGLQSLGIGFDLDPTDVQLDASMRFTFGLDQLVFSLEPIDDDRGDPILDGGEIFVMDMTTNTAEYLSHGGHLWDTDFDVMGTFGVANENINAIDAVPTPGVLAFLVIGGLLGSKRRRR